MLYGRRTFAMKPCRSCAWSSRAPRPASCCKTDGATPSRCSPGEASGLAIRLVGVGMKKRVLVTSILSWPLGGVETHLWNLSKLLVEHGAEVTVAARFAHPEIPLLRDSQELPVHVVSTPFIQVSKLAWRRLSTGWARLVWPL